MRIDEPGGPLPAGATHKIRLLEIDAPETVAPGEPVQCGGPEATAFAEALMPVGSTVYLQADREDTDQYGRFLRYVWTQDGTFYNLEAAVQGIAQVVLYEPNDRHIEELRAAEAEAKAANRGLWGPPCDLDAPPPPPPPPPAPEPEPQQAAGGCDPNYDPCVPPYPPDVNCGDLPFKNIRVIGSDPHRLDRDGDGIGCEG